MADLARSASSHRHVVLTEADEKMLRGKEERAGVQKKTFSKWVNSHLNKVGYKVDELYNDLRDGVNLLKLLEVISGENLPKADKGRARFVMTGNVNKALKFLRWRRRRRRRARACRPLTCCRTAAPRCS